MMMMMILSRLLSSYITNIALRQYIEAIFSTCGAELGNADHFVEKKNVYKADLSDRFTLTEFIDRPRGSN